MATQLSKAYLNYKTDQAADELAGKLEEGFQDEPEDDDEASNGRNPLMLHGILLAGLSTIVLYCISMGLIGGTVLTVAGIISIGTSVVVMGTEFKLSQIDTFRTVHNRLRSDVNRFAGENVKLGKANDELNLQVFCLKESEQRFEELASKQNGNVQDLVKLVAENQVIIDEKKQLVRDDIVHSLIDAAFSSESGEDGTFSDREINRLVNRMRGLPAVTVNEELLREVVNKDKSVISLVELIRDLDVEGEQLGDHIFVIDDNNPKLVKRMSVSQSG